MYWLVFQPCTSGGQCTSSEKEQHDGHTWVAANGQGCDNVPEGQLYCSLIASHYACEERMCDICRQNASPTARAEDSQFAGSPTQGPVIAQRTPSQELLISPPVGLAATPPEPHEMELGTGQIIPIRWLGRPAPKNLDYLGDAHEDRYEKAVRKFVNATAKNPLAYENRAQFKNRQKYFRFEYGRNLDREYRSWVESSAAVFWWPPNKEGTSCAQKYQRKMAEERRAAGWYCYLNTGQKVTADYFEPFRKTDPLDTEKRRYEKALNEPGNRRQEQPLTFESRIRYHHRQALNGNTDRDELNIRYNAWLMDPNTDNRVIPASASLERALQQQIQRTTEDEDKNGVILEGQCEIVDGFVETLRLLSSEEPSPLDRIEQTREPGHTWLRFGRFNPPMEWLTAGLPAGQAADGVSVNEERYQFALQINPGNPDPLPYETRTRFMLRCTAPWRSALQLREIFDAWCYDPNNFAIISRDAEGQKFRAMLARRKK